MKIKNCRICNYQLEQIFSLGKIPIVNFYLTKEDLDKKEKKYSLNFCICAKCGLAQIDEAVSGEKLFSIYHYASSASSPLKKHLEELVSVCVKRFKLKKSSQILDIGCNDGVVLDAFKKKGANVLGIDPARNIQKYVQERGIKVIPDFFNLINAKKIKKEYKEFNLIISTNTLAQVTDLHDFTKGVKLLLSKNGVFVAEVGYLPKMLSKKTFDSIYHEHLSFFSLTSLNKLFLKNGLEIFDAKEIAMHGGSLRIFATHKKRRIKKTKSFNSILEEEKKQKLNKKTSYMEFSDYIKDFKKNFKSTLEKLNREGKKIVGVGAPAKGVVILNYCGINGSIISYIVDSTQYKQNHFLPGVHIPVYPEEKLNEDKDLDYLVLFAWTYREELLKKLDKYKKRGVKIIIPFPLIEIIQ